MLDAIREDDSNNFRRLDVIIHYMAIEDYYGKNENGWELYSKYERTSGRNADKSKAKFINLIKSFEERGCQTEKYPLKISLEIKNLKLLHVRDGAHRLACSIYFGSKYVYGYVAKRPFGEIDIGSVLLLKRKFTEEEIELLEEKKEQILKEVGIKRSE